MFHDERDEATREIEHIDRAARFRENRRAMKALEDAVDTFMGRLARQSTSNCRI